MYKAGNSLIVLDLDPENIDKTKNGLLVKNGTEGLEEYISGSDVIFATVSTIYNHTIDTLYNTFIPLVLFGTTGAEAALLLEISRFYPEATCGKRE